MLRSAILLASELQPLRSWMENSRFAKGMTGRFVAGNTLQDALGAVRELRDFGLTSSLDALGESVEDEAQAEQATAEYEESVQAIASCQLPSTISLKLTQLGLGFSQARCAEHLMRIVRRARAAGIRVEIDMESSAYVDSTLEVVSEAHRSGGLVRAVIQAYLHRSEADIRMLNRARIPVRLCKGAYKEKPDVAMQRKRDVDRTFVDLTELLLREGTLPAIATHDERILKQARQQLQSANLAPGSYEFQMLYGIRRDLQAELIEQGHPVRIYIPYGQAWYPYLMRRMAERPANLLFVLRNLAG
jgi:proline dehydrogenase